MKYVNKGIRKKDAMALVTGKPVYTEDIAPSNCLVVKLLRSPHAHALIEDINTLIASKVPGIECILTYKDVPNCRFTTAGQSYPEPSPYDRLILDRRLRCVGDPVAIVAGENEKAVNKALKLIKVKYEVLDAVLDFRQAKDNEVLVHPEEDFKALNDWICADNKRNICSTGGFTHGDIEEEFSKCTHIVEETYHTKANNQSMMETFRTYTELDTYGRLNVTSATQVPFHVRRILANALDIPKSRIRVIKPRIGGGFGAKQSVVSEIFPAIVTLKTGKPACMVFSRSESLTNGSPRHEMEIKVKVGADENGIIKAIYMYTLSNAGAYGEHGPTTVGLSAHKSMPLYRSNAYKFEYDVVYSNTMGAGAYRGYGATQGIFALESAVNELAAKLNMDPTKLRELNMVREGDVMHAYYGEVANSCTLDKCLAKAKAMIDWDNKYPYKDMGNGKVRSVGVAMAMQGSGISAIDTAAVEIKLNDDGFYTLMIGAADMGTGCDTILAQMAADCLECDVDNIIVHGVDTDQSPYDTGSYASSTTYVTGGAVLKTCNTLKKKMLELSSQILDCPEENLEFDGKRIYSLEDNKEISLVDLANGSLVAGSKTISASESHFENISPPPFMVGLVETEIDKLTGNLEIIDYVAVVDCGTVINPNLARVQTEGGIAQGIGMALYEDIVYSKSGKMMNNSFLQYKIPTRLDVGNIRVDFESSYEPTGPFGAKSIGEIVINTPSPALANAVYNATKVNIRNLPITSEKIVMGMLENEN